MRWSEDSNLVPVWMDGPSRPMAAPGQLWGIQQRQWRDPARLLSPLTAGAAQRRFWGKKGGGDWPVATGAPVCAAVCRCNRFAIVRRAEAMRRRSFLLHINQILLHIDQVINGQKKGWGGRSIESGSPHSNSAAATTTDAPNWWCESEHHY